MCGIHVSISTREFQNPSQKLLSLLCSRGPDHIGHETSLIEDTYGLSYWISLSSTVLALRGGTITPQPFRDLTTDSLLCWNGEAWKIDAQSVLGNDGQAVFEALIRANSAQKSVSEARDATLSVLRGIFGPFAFVFLDKIHSQIYFGRDRLGRRSLLRKEDDEHMELASIADSTFSQWTEVEADGIYQISCVSEVPSTTHENLSDAVSISRLPVLKHPWESECPLVSIPEILENLCIISDNTLLQHPSLGVFNWTSPLKFHSLDLHTESVNILRYQLSESLKLRILNVPEPPGLDQAQNVRIAILFSGGLDCTVLARMAHDILPHEQSIDLINVAFENPRVIQAAKNAVKSRKPQSADKEVQVNSGLPSLEDNGSSAISHSPFESCPDRETGRKSFQELQDVCPGRVWRFIAVDVSYTETLAHRTNIIGLIHPHNTEMDLSIAYALYFAARGTGAPTSNQPGEPATYTTPARVLLSGLGADELFGGYTRHATAFMRNGLGALLNELELDINRLGKRNLGRDDRVISNWGREARFPYLDESLVKWAVESPIWDKCGFTTPSGLEAGGDRAQTLPNIEAGKKVLRLLAYGLGMRSVAMEKKRAIQFGARTAKMEVGRTKGTSLIS